MTDASSPKTEHAEPLVSVICRTTNRPLLVEAIASVANQNYRPIEIILVDATGLKVFKSKRFPLQISQ